MATDTVGEDFVTIVPVGESRTIPKDSVESRSTFVTVLTVGSAAGAAEVVVRRPRGARLGLGLKFEGGSAAAEKVRRLLVQSCAEDSPAANAIAPWGKLIPGDEILAIDGICVSELTRIDCVRRLKDSDEMLTLLVRHIETMNESDKNKTIVDSVAAGKVSEITRPTLPPPVPPRKLGKKNSFKDKQTLQTVGEQNGLLCTGGLDKDKINGQQNGAATNFTKLSRKSSFDSHIHRQGKEGITYLKKGSPEEGRRLVRRLSDGKTMPPDAEVYIDLLSTEWERCLALADAESDDTGSSISTVVDRLGSMANSVENSIPSTPTMQPKTIDIQKVLNCIENIDSNILKDMSTTRFLDKDKIDIKDDSKLNDKNVNIKTVSTHEALKQETLKQITLLSSDIKSVKKLESNDKNNNNTIVHTTCTMEISETCKMAEKTAVKDDPVVDKPKPMPRNTKIERSVSEKKSRPIPVTSTPPPSVLEPLLTPTKKNCIETWLQRSEAEMKNKPAEKMEETTVPEALPRLIDFVPKPHYKESGTESAAPLPRPTTAPPPPPPTDPREDGSGASLDTIGDFDESCDVTDNAKPTVNENETRDRKPTFDSSFWEDRVNKSDAEDKSHSNDETPLPTCPRQPPDGVETPADAVENAPELPSRLPPRLPAGWPTTRTRYSYTSRTQDARSEASVKDKIAMFSNDRAPSSDQLDSCGTLPKNLTVPRKSTTSYTNSYNEVSSLDRRLTKSQDNLDEVPRSYQRHLERPEVLGAIESKVRKSSKEAAQILSARQVDSKPMFYGSTTTLPSNIEKTFSQPVYHARSISDDNGDKSVHKSNLEYLIEQRKKSLSKLRGLVIPEVQSPIVDLPEIKVQDNIMKSFMYKSNINTNISNKQTTTSHKKIIDLNETNWKTNLLPNNLPKYSPAFKRKSLQVYTPSSLSKESTPERKFNEKVDALNKLNSKTFAPRPAWTTSDIKNGTLPAKFSPTTLNKGSSNDYKSILNNRDYKNVEIKICTATEIVDSDNDSAMSSTQSSYRSSASSPLHNLDSIESDSSRLSPRLSHYTSYSIVKTELPIKSVILEKSCEEYVKRNVCRSVSSDTNVSLSSSAGSAATSGSQASCSSLESSVADSDKRKVSKSCNIDTINRRNILASAKCRSGRDAKLKSPVVETKFSHESYEKSPSPTRNASERLSTLTSSVSAISNKGESRRRNKVIAETDSDSDQEVNVRQRKTDFKNSRLKRNSSSANKTKPSEVVVETTKVEDPPKVISETIIKEINQTGLNNVKNVQVNNQVVKASEKSGEHEPKLDIIPMVQEKNILKSSVQKCPLNVRKNIPIKEPTYKMSNGNGFLSDKSDLSSLEESKLPTQIIRLQKGASSGVGLILAGGIDCEAKDVTVHRVLADSVAAKAGLKRGAKIRSINNCSMMGLTHAQTVAILKEQRAEVVIEIENEIQDNTSSVTCGSDNAESKARGGETETERGSVVSVLLDKAGGGAGLGFGLDGGRDSPHGDRPLTVKKLFAGGAAAQSGRILVGAELLSAGGTSMEGFTRTQAWAALKALPAGPVTLVLRNPVGK